jgi:serpin B
MIMKAIWMTKWMVPALAATITAVPLGRPTDLPNIALQNNEFAFSLYQQVAAGNENNVFFSPFSISTALAMTYAGAAGSTADAMSSAMNFSANGADFHSAYGNYLDQLELSADGHVDLRIANRLWAERSYALHPTFLDINAAAYRSALQPMNFTTAAEQSREEINQWVAQKTDGRILDLIPQGVINPMTRLVLTNAIYFKGDWLHAFDEKDTQERKFYLKDSAAVDRDFMHRRGNIHYADNERFQLLRLPYKGEKQSMVLVLPKRNVALETVQADMNSTLINKAFQTGQPEVILALPKFKLTIPLSLKDHLVALGMAPAFEEGANFSAMTPSNDLFISEVIHKAFIEIDEKGTEAAAATAVVMQQTSSSYGPPKSPKIFTADRPFLFYIVDNESQSILFMGRIMDPQQ